MPSAVASAVVAVVTVAPVVDAVARKPRAAGSVDFVAVEVAVAGAAAVAGAVIAKGVGSPQSQPFVLVQLPSLSQAGQEKPLLSQAALLVVC